VGRDRTKQFLSKNAHLIPEGEAVVAVVVGQAEGGALRRGLVEAGGNDAELASYEQRERERAEKQRRASRGDAALWPVAPSYWLVLTDESLHVLEGKVNGADAGPGRTTYPRERIAGVEYRRRLLTSSLTVRFVDGSSIGLDVGWQKMRPFVRELAAGRRGRGGH
jgi:hypothetical protein